MQSLCPAHNRPCTMQNLSKKSEALSSVEDRLKAAVAEAVALGGELSAKKSECQALEGQLAESEAALSSQQVQG